MKVIAYKTVTTEDNLSQRHKKLGAVDIYGTLGSDNIAVLKNGHNNNASITNYMVVNVREQQPQTNSWYGLKQLEKSLQHIATYFCLIYV